MSNPNIKDHASKGGLARASNLTPQQRSEASRLAVKARWKKYRAKKNHICEFMCKCSVCGRRKDKGPHTKSSGDGQHEFKCTKII